MRSPGWSSTAPTWARPSSPRCGPGGRPATGSRPLLGPGPRARGPGRGGTERTDPRSPGAAATTSTCSTPAAPPACPRASSGATRTSSSPPSGPRPARHCSAGPSGPAASHPCDMVARAETGRTRTLIASPLIHGTAQWVTLATLLAGGTVLTLPVVDVRRHRAVGPGRRPRRPPWWSSWATPSPGPSPTPWPPRPVGGTSATSPPSCPGGPCCRPRCGPSWPPSCRGRRSSTATAPARPAARATRSAGPGSAGDPHPVPARGPHRAARRRGQPPGAGHPHRSHRAAGPTGPHPPRLPQRRRADRRHLPDHRRRALGHPRRPRSPGGRRQRHPPRPGRQLDQHRRREGLPRRGRGGAEGPPLGVRRRRRRACPTSAGASGWWPSSPPATGTAPSVRDLDAHCRAHLASYKVPRRRSSWCRGAAPPLGQDRPRVGPGRRPRRRRRRPGGRRPGRRPPDPGA